MKKVSLIILALTMLLSTGNILQARRLKKYRARVHCRRRVAVYRRYRVRRGGRWIWRRRRHYRYKTRIYRTIVYARNRARARIRVRKRYRRCRGATRITLRRIR